MHSKSRTHGGLNGGYDYLSKSMYGVPFTTNYQVNGTGRDSYIGIDNGGFYVRSDPSKAADSGMFGGTGPKFFQTYNARAPTKYVGYKSNGSGRDTYIANSNGGLYPAQTVAAYKKGFFE